MESSRETTVMFASVIGTADLYAKAGDKGAIEAMERCHHRLNVAAASAGGRFSKSANDKLMVLATAPDAAADAASAMHVAIEKLPKTAGIKLGLGIGFHFGPVIQKDEGVFGDTVTLAARLCESAGNGQIITTELTANLLSPLYRGWVRELDKAHFKGRSDDTGLCELVWRADENATAVQRAKPEQKSPLSVLTLTYRGQPLVRRREKETITIGRGEDCGLVVQDEQASRHHCTIERRTDKWVISDLSTNGTFVTIEGEKEIALQHEEVMLSKRGRVTLGQPGAKATEFIEFSIA